MKAKLFRVEGSFVTSVSKIVRAKTEAEAVRKARDSAVKYVKLKSKGWDKNNCAVWEVM